jgi:hypothetical protein
LPLNTDIHGLFPYSNSSVHHLGHQAGGRAQPFVVRKELSAIFRTVQARVQFATGLDQREGLKAQMARRVRACDGLWQDLNWLQWMG